MIFASIFEATQKDVSRTEETNAKRAKEGKKLFPIPTHSGSIKEMGAESPHSFMKAFPVEALKIELTGETEGSVVITPNEAKENMLAKADAEGNHEEFEKVSQWSDFNGFAYIKKCASEEDKGFVPASGKFVTDSSGKTRISLAIGTKTKATA